jgi:hypothetical protein
MWKWREDVDENVEFVKEVMFLNGFYTSIESLYQCRQGRG